MFVLTAAPTDWANTQRAVESIRASFCTIYDALDPERQRRVVLTQDHAKIEWARDRLLQICEE